MMKAAVVMMVWSMWAGHRMVEAGYSFGVLLPIAGILGIVAAATLTANRSK